MHRSWCEKPSELLETAMLKLKLMDEDGEGPDEDQWDGYPAERDAVLDKFSTLDDVVVLSADIHVSVASQLSRNGTPVAVEITSPSLTSQNLDEKLKLDPRDETIVASEREFTEALDHVEWCEFSGHGYVVCDVDRERLRAEWWLVDGVLESLPGESMAAAYEIRRGAPELSRA
jgi:alkaline phosphatase D